MPTKTLTTQAKPKKQIPIKPEVKSLKVSPSVKKKLNAHTRKHEPKHGELESIVPPITPKDTEVKFAGPEPYYDPLKPITDSTKYQHSLINSFNWYTRFFEVKDAKGMMVTWLEKHKRENDIKVIKKVPDKIFKQTYGWMARMILRGFVFNAKDMQNLENEIIRLSEVVGKQEAEKAKLESQQSELKAKPVRSKEEIELENTQECAGELEGKFDEFMQSPKASHDIKPIQEFIKANKPVSNKYIAEKVVKVWETRKAEFDEAITGKDKQLNEAYKKFSKTELKHAVKFCDLVLTDLGSVAQVAKMVKVAVKKPRQTANKPIKAPSFDKFKYLKTFKVSDTVLLSSVLLSKLHGSSEAFLYDTAKRKLIYVVADPNTKKLEISGTTIIGFDTKKTSMKTIRKPEVEIAEFLKLGKPASRKYYTETIQTVASEWPGRSNENIIILKIL